MMIGMIKGAFDRESGCHGEQTWRTHALRRAAALRFRLMLDGYISPFGFYDQAIVDRGPVGYRWSQW